MPCFLKQNIQANRLNNIVACNAAVSDKTESATLLLSSESDWQHMLIDQINLDKIEEYKRTFPPPTPEEPEQWVDVPTTTLLEIMDSNHLEQIDFLKMDCQGSEGSILQSTPREYLQRIRRIAMEFHTSV